MTAAAGRDFCVLAVVTAGTAWPLLGLMDNSRRGFIRFPSIQGCLMTLAPKFRSVFAFSAALLVGFLSSLPTTLQAEDWPGFRGPRGDGTSADTQVPTTWSASENVTWKVKLPGAGFSSPIVVGKRVLVTAYSGRDDNVQRHLLCYDRATGKQLWKQSVAGVADGGEGSFYHHGQASHTPVSDGKNVYVMFGSSGVRAYDLSGKELWTKKVGNERAARFGTSSSPILYKNLLIVTAGAESESIRGFDSKTGKEVWKTEAGSLSGTYSTPQIVTNPAGKDELVLSVTGETWSMNPLTGKLNWYATTKVDTAACPTIVSKDGVVYVIGGRSGGRAAIRTGGTDDVTDSHVVWSEFGGSYVPSPILHDGKLFWINDSGLATCVDAKTGKQLARKRLGGRYYASMVLIGDKFYAVSRFGGTKVLKATPEFETIATNTLGDESDFSGSPAVSNGQLFLRSVEYLYCIGKAR